MALPFDSNSPTQKRLDAVATKVGALQVAQASLYAAVRQARDEGASWSEVAAALGVTKQAAQQRFG